MKKHKSVVKKEMKVPGFDKPIKVKKPVKSAGKKKTPVKVESVKKVISAKKVLKRVEGNKVLKPVKSEVIANLEKLKDMCKSAEPVQQLASILNKSTGGSEVNRKDIHEIIKTGPDKTMTPLFDSLQRLQDKPKKEITTPEAPSERFTISDIESAVLHTLPTLHDESLATVQHYVFQAALRLFIKHDITSRNSRIIQFALINGVYKK